MRHAPLRAGIVSAVCAVALLSSGTAEAHALSPSMLMLRERAPGVVDVTWKTPLMRLPGSEIKPILPATCTPTVRDQVDEDSDSATVRSVVDCGGASLVGMRVGVEGLAPAKTDALLHVELADGRTIDTVLRASEPFIAIPAAENRLGLAARYAQLGFEHIMTGYDHLLFVFGLLLLAAGTRALVATITAFTLGHSVTLTLAVLGVTRIPSAPIEVLIAVTIFVLAVELARPPATTLMRRTPWVMALTFGLLHGLGFAGTLRATGLPPDSIPLALVSFNIGIELGQLAFVLAVTAVAAAARPVTVRLPAWSHAVPVYAMGTLAAFWIIQRSFPLIR
jgi:hydrogenase/urease accessory protein HupE